VPVSELVRVAARAGIEKGLDSVVHAYNKKTDIFTIEPIGEELRHFKLKCGWFYDEIRADSGRFGVLRLARTSRPNQG